MDPIFVTIGLLGLLAFFVVIDIGVGEASQGDLATKTDLAGVRTEIAELRTELNPHSPADA